MKKYLPAVAGVVTGVAAVAVLTAPTAVGAASPAQAQAQVPAPASAAPAAKAEPVAVRKASAPTRVRTVRSGELVDAGKGYTVWLTPEGKHWSDPDGMENFRSVVDGNIDPSEPGVSHQSAGDPNGVFHSGLYYGTKTAGRVELTDRAGNRTRAALLELPGRPGWGVWYVHTGPSDGTFGGHGVALYDRGGKLLADLPAMDF